MLSNLNTTILSYENPTGKVVLLGDTHFGMRNDSIHFHKHLQQFYKEFFFPTLRSRGIKHIIQVGDLFDRRKFINFQTLQLCRDYFFEQLKKDGITMVTILGNHDVYFRNTNEVNSPRLLLNEYNRNIDIVTRPSKLIYMVGQDSKLVSLDLIPWICTDNLEETKNFIAETKNSVCIGHFELSGFNMDKISICKEGMDAKILKDYKQVYSGHFHSRSRGDNVFYIGTPYEMTWIDHDDPKGFVILDLENQTEEIIQNPFNMFYTIEYDDTKMVYSEMAKLDYSIYTGKFVKVVIRKKTNVYLFDKLIDFINSANPVKLTIVDEFVNPNFGTENFEVDEAQDTLSIFNSYIDELKLDRDVSSIKSIVRDVYFTATGQSDSEA